MSTTIQIAIEGWPPSLNAYWRSINGRNILSREARLFRKSVVLQMFLARARKQLPRDRIAYPVRVDVELWPPDKRRRDLDNYCKGLFDSLTHARVWADDSLVWDYRVHWGLGTVHGGRVVLTIEEFGLG